MEQNAGLYYSKQHIAGYYNDLRGKVTEKTILDAQGVPINMEATGRWIYFPISIFQYGLGVYDLFLETKDVRYKQKLLNILNWALENQQEDGAWDTFGYFQNPTLSPVSAMAQGEGASALLRGYVVTNDEKYLRAAKKAIDFMLIPVENGGTTVYKNESIIFEEYIGEGKSTVLNGWIFAVFGLFDYCLLTKDKQYLEVLNKTITTMVQSLHCYDRGYWSNYNTKGSITSPFYHNLHIEQLKVMFDLFGKDQFKFYHDKWLENKKSRVKSSIAFLIKVIQKLLNSELKGALVK